MTIDRDALMGVILNACESGDAIWAKDAEDIADAVIAHLSAVPVEGEVEWAARVDFEGLREPIFYEYPDPLSADRFIKNPPLWFDQERHVIAKVVVSRTKAGPWREVTQ